MLGTVYTSYRNPHASYYNCIWNNQTDIQRSWTIYRGLHGTPLQYSCLENPLDGGAWQATVHGVAKSRTRLSDFTFTFHFPTLEKEMATHSSVLAWRIPGTEEPGGLLSMESHWSDLAAAAAAAAAAADTQIMTAAQHKWRMKQSQGSTEGKVFVEGEGIPELCMTSTIDRFIIHSGLPY